VTEFFSPMKIQVSALWVVKLCSDVVGYRRFWGSKFPQNVSILHGVTVHNIATWISYLLI